MIGFNMLGQLGRLGNQMFQVASLRGIASNNNYNYAIPPSKNKNEWTDHQLFNPFVFEGVNPLNIQFIDFQRPQVAEASFSFDEKLFNDCPDWVSLVGFFQSEKYFKHIEDTVHSMFAFRPEILEPCQSMINGVEKPVSLHIRRGDYLTNYKNHHNLGLDYYAKALEHFKDNQIVIFKRSFPMIGFFPKSFVTTSINFFSLNCVGTKCVNTSFLQRVILATLPTIVEEV